MDRNLIISFNVNIICHKHEIRLIIEMRMKMEKKNLEVEKGKWDRRRELKNKCAGLCTCIQSPQ